MYYRVEVLPQPRKTLAKIPRPMAARIVEAIESLAENPRPIGATKLRGFRNIYRIRVADYRVVYEIHDDRLVVLVIRVGHRRDVYR